MLKNAPRDLVLVSSMRDTPINLLLIAGHTEGCARRLPWEWEGCPICGGDDD